MRELKTKSCLQRHFEQSLVLGWICVVAGCDTNQIDQRRVGRDVEGARGEQGEPGPRGVRGPTGPAWRPVTYVVTDAVDVEPHDWNTAVAECDEGDIVLNGGCEWGSYTLDGYTMGSIIPYLDTPIGQDGGPDAFRMWQCQGLSVVDHVTTIYAVATCLAVGDE